ncbi:hypothetical protein QBC36DRAFT_291267 [Triangularia setosa]|uniref:Uncharacterized protein n=1 Tax=Triangularia setosa TaxID=2587417 RepID=A0AAN7A712_9PEZI|nr:hypothetical protein QBC36DRAFT_291267 [Podospora setosa]
MPDPLPLPVTAGTTEDDGTALEGAEAAAPNTTAELELVLSLPATTAALKTDPAVTGPPVTPAAESKLALAALEALTLAAERTCRAEITLTDTGMVVPEIYTTIWPVVVAEIIPTLVPDTSISTMTASPSWRPAPAAAEAWLVAPLTVTSTVVVWVVVKSTMTRLVEVVEVVVARVVVVALEEVGVVTRIAEMVEVEVVEAV